VPAAPALAAVAGFDPVLQQLLAYVALMGVDGVVGEVERLGVGVRLALEVLGPGRVLFRLERADVGINVVGPAASAASAPAVTTAAATTAVSVAAATTALTATAATSISVLH